MAMGKCETRKKKTAHILPTLIENNYFRNCMANRWPNTHNHTRERAQTMLRPFAQNTI